MVFFFYGSRLSSLLGLDRLIHSCQQAWRQYLVTGPFPQAPQSIKRGHIGSFRSTFQSFRTMKLWKKYNVYYLWEYAKPMRRYQTDLKLLSPQLPNIMIALDLPLLKLDYYTRASLSCVREGETEARFLWGRTSYTDREWFVSVARPMSLWTQCLCRPLLLQRRSIMLENHQCVRFFLWWIRIDWMSSRASQARSSQILFVSC